ncbi:hypothetical protein C0993_006776 [Termitomyces sp. T159_Od127]|nr:hypothetical protein C0993_006776 [Termitomyces sp. T159_Od127]
MFLHAPQPRCAQQEPPKTPVRRRSQSLHRAVLIRSAQRAVMKAERDMREREEEEMEEMEALDAVASLDGERNDVEEKGDEMRHEDEFEQGEEDTSMDVDMDVDMEEPLAGISDDEEDNMKQKPKQKLSWRKSFERLRPFRSSSPVKDEEDHSDRDEENENEGEMPAHARTSSSPTSADEEDENEDLSPLFAPPRTPLRPQLQHRNKGFGPFMTPQPRIGTSVSDPAIQCTHEQAEVGIGQGRFSLGGGKARRILVEPQVWRVKDIVVPPPSPAVGGGGGTKGAFASPVRPGVLGSPRKVIDEDERKAIQERRRSALREPSVLGFVPGFSPMKMKAARIFPGGVGSGPGVDVRPISPMKSSTQPTLPSLPTEEKEEEEDTRRLLDRMRETVEGMKRRRSEVPPLKVPMTPSREMDGEIGRGRSPVKKGEVFSLLRTEQAEEGHGEAAEETEMTRDMEVEEATSQREEEDEKAGLSAPVSVQDMKDVCADAYTPTKKDEEPTRQARFMNLLMSSKSPAPITHQEELQGMSTVHRRAKSRPKSRARSPSPVRDREAETVSTQSRSRSMSRAKSPAPDRVQEDKKDDVVMEESRSGTDEQSERVEEASDEPARAEKSPSKLRSRSTSTLRAPASNGRTISEPKQVGEETKVLRRKVTKTPTVKGETLQPEEAPLKRGRKATTTMGTVTTTPAVLVSSSQGEPAPTRSEPAPTRRGRKPTAEPEVKEPPKRGRKLGITTTATAPSKKTDAPKRSLRKMPVSASIPVVKNELVKRGRTPHAGSVVPASNPTAKTAGMVNRDDGSGVQ